MGLKWFNSNLTWVALPALSVGNYCSVKRMSASHTASLHVAATGLLLSPALLLLTPAPARHKTRLSPPGPASPTAAGQTVSVSGSGFVRQPGSQWGNVRLIVRWRGELEVSLWQLVPTQVTRRDSVWWPSWQEADIFSHLTRRPTVSCVLSDWYHHIIIYLDTNIIYNEDIILYIKYL